MLMYFPEFNIVEIVCSDKNIHQFDEKSKEEKKYYITQRNNFLLRILIEAKGLKNKEEQIPNSDLFQDLNFLKNYIDNLTKKLIEKEIDLEIDVEIFFYCLLGFKDKATYIVVKFIDYLRNFIIDFKTDSHQQQTRVLFENLTNIIFKSFEDMSTEEIIIIRKIINNCAKRKFFKGLEYIANDDTFCLMITEGRIWKSIIKYFTENDV